MSQSFCICKQTSLLDVAIVKGPSEPLRPPGHLSKCLPAQDEDSKRLPSLPAAMSPQPRQPNHH